MVTVRADWHDSLAGVSKDSKTAKLYICFALLSLLSLSEAGLGGLLSHNTYRTNPLQRTRKREARREKKRRKKRRSRLCVRCVCALTACESACSLSLSFARTRTHNSKLTLSAVFRNTKSTGERETHGTAQGKTTIRWNVCTKTESQQTASLYLVFLNLNTCT